MQSLHETTLQQVGKSSEQWEKLNKELEEMRSTNKALVAAWSRADIELSVEALSKISLLENSIANLKCELDVEKTLKVKLAEQNKGLQLKLEEERTKAKSSQDTLELELEKLRVQEFYNSLEEFYRGLTKSNIKESSDVVTPQIFDNKMLVQKVDFFLKSLETILQDLQKRIDSGVPLLSSSHMSIPAKHNFNEAVAPLSWLAPARRQIQITLRDTMTTATPMDPVTDRKPSAGEKRLIL